MKIVALLAILLSSCSSGLKGIPIPIYNNGPQQLCFCTDCPPVENTAIAIKLTDNLLRRFEYPHPEAFERLYIEWYVYDDGPLYGLTKSPTTIQLWDITPGDIQGSALVHELIHVALWEYYDDPDSDHLSWMFDHKDGQISIESEGNAKIREFNL